MEKTKSNFSSFEQSAEAALVRVQAERTEKTKVDQARMNYEEQDKQVQKTFIAKAEPQNARAALEIYGRTETKHHQENGQTVSSTVEHTGILDEIALNPKYGKTPEERNTALEDYKSELEQLQSEHSLELSQAKLIMDLRNQRKEHRTNPSLEQRYKELDKRTIARIKDGQITSLEEFNDKKVIKTDSTKKGNKPVSYQKRTDEEVENEWRKALKDKYEEIKDSLSRVPSSTKLQSSTSSFEDLAEMPINFENPTDIEKETQESIVSDDVIEEDKKAFVGLLTQMEAEDDSGSDYLLTEYSGSEVPSTDPLISPEKPGLPEQEPEAIIQNIDTPEWINETTIPVFEKSSENVKTSEEIEQPTSKEELLDGEAWGPILELDYASESPLGNIDDFLDQKLPEPSQENIDTNRIISNKPEPYEYLGEEPNESGDEHEYQNEYVVQVSEPEPTTTKNVIPDPQFYNWQDQDLDLRIEAKKIEPTTIKVPMFSEEDALKDKLEAITDDWGDEAPSKPLIPEVEPVISTEASLDQLHANDAILSQTQPSQEPEAIKEVEEPEIENEQEVATEPIDELVKDQPEESLDLDEWRENFSDAQQSEEIQDEDDEPPITQVVWVNREDPEQPDSGDNSSGGQKPFEDRPKASVATITPTKPDIASNGNEAIDPTTLHPQPTEEGKSPLWHAFWGDDEPPINGQIRPMGQALSDTFWDKSTNHPDVLVKSDESFTNGLASASKALHDTMSGPNTTAPELIDEQLQAGLETIEIKGLPAILKDNDTKLDTEIGTKPSDEKAKTLEEVRKEADKSIIQGVTHASNELQPQLTNPNGEEKRLIVDEQLGSYLGEIEPIEGFPQTLDENEESLTTSFNTNNTKADDAEIGDVVEEMTDIETMKKRKDKRIYFDGKKHYGHRIARSIKKRKKKIDDKKTERRYKRDRKKGILRIWYFK